MDHEAFGLIKGEWNYKTNEEYNGEFQIDLFLTVSKYIQKYHFPEIKNLHTFISRLDDSGGAYSVQSKIKTLHRYCMSINDNSDMDLELDKAFHYLRE